MPLGCILSPEIGDDTPVIQFVWLSRCSINVSCYFFFFCEALQDFSSLAMDRTWTLAVKALSPNYWAAREFPP